ncbi:HPP family protein [Thioclava sp. 'Guangxiensis']|uniref:HPP family protein n=1 Tax=Thioclava sp. 'Guangxiensis' TaxID=3149044 RepID=UPI003877F6A0
MMGKFGGRAPMPPRPSVAKVLAAFTGGTIGIGALALLTSQYNAHLLMAPFGASCVLLFATPDVPLAQPRNVIGGHFFASLIGLIAAHYLPVIGPLELGVAVGLAIALMQVTRTLHAPAGADPLVIMLMGKAVPWTFLLTPVLAGSVILVLIALIVNNVERNSKWPKYWHGHKWPWSQA